MAASHAGASSSDCGPSKTSRSVFTTTGVWPRVRLASIAHTRNSDADLVFILAWECKDHSPSCKSSPVGQFPRWHFRLRVLGQRLRRLILHSRGRRTCTLLAVVGVNTGKSVLLTH